MFSVFFALTSNVFHNYSYYSNMYVILLTDVFFYNICVHSKLEMGFHEQWLFFFKAAYKSAFLSGLLFVIQGVRVSQ